MQKNFGVKCYRGGKLIPLPRYKRGVSRPSERRFVGEKTQEHSRKKYATLGGGERKKK